jgi:hypothetical protein
MDYMALKAKNKALNSEEARTGKVYLKSKPVFFSLEGVSQVSADKAQGHIRRHHGPSVRSYASQGSLLRLTEGGPRSMSLPDPS